eukprot:6175470-Pleurochrysis_carterae.AAC.2
MHFEHKLTQQTPPCKQLLDCRPTRSNSQNKSSLHVARSAVRIKVRRRLSQQEKSGAVKRHHRAAAPERRSARGLELQRRRR